MSILCILGRQPKIGLAELESIFGSEAIETIGDTAALLSVKAERLQFARLGGTIKAARILSRFDTVNWPDIESELLKIIPKHTETIPPDGKLKLGLSAYGLNTTVRQINRSALKLKGVIKSQGQSIRIVPNKENALNAAQITHNRLTGPTGQELILVRAGKTTILGQTFAVQNIKAYAARDQARPKRDARVGMLPPKLAQIIINLATANAEPLQSETILDPFCGTGVILQEALLMGFDIYGSDIDTRMIEYCIENLVWLTNQSFSGMEPISEHDLYRHVKAADATSESWSPMPNFIAAEAYLGRPFAVLPPSQTLNLVVRDVNTIITKFLKNVTRQTKTGFRMCLAMPAWRKNNGFVRLPVLDSLPQLGYNRLSFVHALNEELIYHRPNQIVGRELVTIVRN